mmetsp:Transcript_438/g.1146  ORF Transcript_438/g.1146 Transcript_438/m.1146 type:complete len:226 (-) Transcript_438:1063-1740(-)
MHLPGGDPARHPWLRVQLQLEPKVGIAVAAGCGIHCPLDVCHRTAEMAGLGRCQRYSLHGLVSTIHALAHQGRRRQVKSPRRFALRHPGSHAVPELHQEAHAALAETFPSPAGLARRCCGARIAGRTRCRPCVCTWRRVCLPPLHPGYCNGEDIFHEGQHVLPGFRAVQPGCYFRQPIGAPGVAAADAAGCLYPGKNATEVHLQAAVQLLHHLLLLLLHGQLLYR